MLLLFLLRAYQRHPQSLELVRHTAEAMARGGIYDQIAGGFHRYTVDATWTVPHFEKMLYDNALLIRVYTEIHRLTGDPMAKRIAHDTADFLIRDLGTAEGGFASALDADTDGVEGLTYAWNREQIGDDWASDLFGVTEAGTFEHGLSVLKLMRDIDDAAPEIQERWRAEVKRLKEIRDTRPQPGRDDKIVASWNGLAITALAELARLSKRDDLARAAVKAGQLLAETHLVNGRLKRVSKDGKVGQPDGVLEDYGCVAEAFGKLHEITNEAHWLEKAKALLDTAIARFSDGANGFFDTADDAEKLVTRPADPTDNATPSGLSSVVSALLTITALSGEPRYHEAAQRALENTGPLIKKFPRFAGYAAAAAEALLSGPVEIAITNDAELYDTAVKHAPGGAVIVKGEPDQPGVPLLEGRNQRNAAYVCHGFVCQRPVTSSVELTTMLRLAD